MKSELVKLRVSAEQRDAWQAEASRAGLTLSTWARRSLDETVALANALESQVEDARRKQRLREEAERPRLRRPAARREPERRMGDRAGWGTTVGQALADADRRG